MGKLDLKFLLMLFLPVLGIFCIFFGEQIYRGQLADALQEQQVAFNKDEAIEVSAKLFSQDCVGFNRRHGLHRNGLELVYVYAFRGQTYTKTFFAPMSHCKRQDLSGRGEKTGYRDIFPILVLEQAPATSYPKLLLHSPDFNQTLEDQKRPDHGLRNMIRVVGKYPLIVVFFIGFLWVSSRFKSWLYS